MCAGGPPKPTQPMRPHSASTTPSGARGCGSSASGLEELDRVPRWVVDDDLLAARALDHLVAEAHVGGAEAFDLGVDVVDDQVDAVPASRLGLAPVGHRP